MGDGKIPDEVIGFTLWGDPVYRVKRTRGRPPFEWTEENSRKVSMLLACGWSNERIAGTILDPRTGKKISVPTLKRHFRSELDHRDNARDQLKARQLMTAAQAAFDGNVSAMRLLEQLIDKNDRMQAEREVAARAPVSKPQAADRLGKKAMVRAQAHDAEAELMLELEREAAGHVRN
ncbi:hypothetical protein ACTTAL_03495 [Rhodobacter capsulatus]|uniref:hypothetical protein n=1 Tax=Rhodobacter capsulatus TaxID=1061 RepID=UPI0006855A56|nr:hypothetical protein [Rhodobacter capsulatus]